MTEKKINEILAQARVMDAQNEAFKYCKACAIHYGDDGICDQGKPMASPHRSQPNER